MQVTDRRRVAYDPDTKEVAVVRPDTLAETAAALGAEAAPEAPELAVPATRLPPAPGRAQSLPAALAAALAAMSTAPNGLRRRVVAAAQAGDEEAVARLLATRVRHQGSREMARRRRQTERAAGRGQRPAEPAIDVDATVAEEQAR